MARIAGGSFRGCALQLVIDSMAWTRASTPVATGREAGSPAVISGSSSASFGKTSSPQARTLVPSASEKTETAPD